jgi:hypothetical protein
MNFGNGPLGLNPLDTRVIKWDIPKVGICLLELFGIINYKLAAVLQLGILVQRYRYVEKDPQDPCGMS